MDSLRGAVCLPEDGAWLVDARGLVVGVVMAEQSPLSQLLLCPVFLFAPLFLCSTTGDWDRWIRGELMQARRGRRFEAVGSETRSTAVAVVCITWNNRLSRDIGS